MATRVTHKSTRSSLRPVTGIKNQPVAVVPTQEKRHANKPAYEGRIVEVKAMRQLRRHGFSVWLKPGQRGQRLSTAKGYIPDMATRIDGLEGLGVRMLESATRSTSLTANVLFEVKGQTVNGSVDQKISATIEDLAFIADTRRIIPVLILDTPVYTEDMMDKFRREGAQHLVVVVTPDDIRNGMLLPAIEKVARSRRNLYRKLDRNGRVKERFAHVNSPFVTMYRARHIRGGNMPA